MREVRYNNLTKIFLNLEPSIGYLADWNEWNEFEDTQIEKLKSLSKELGLKSSIIVFEDNNTHNGLWNYSNIYKKALDSGVDQIICYYKNPMWDQLAMNDFVNDFNNQLNFKHVAYDVNYKNYLDNRFDSNFFIDNWNENSHELGNASTKPKNDKLKAMLLANDFDLFFEETSLNYSFSGRVAHGLQQGRQIGYPTANLEVNNSILIDKGVYAVDLYHEHSNTHYLGAGCYWINSRSEDVFETFIIDYNGPEIYDQQITVTPIQFIRKNKPFTGLEDLKNLLQSDVDLIKQIDWDLHQQG